MPRPLILFDVDGTLLLSGGATTRCIWRAAEATFGRPLERCKLTAGLLDPQLFASIAAYCGIENAAARLEDYKRAYLLELADELHRTRDQVKVMPGVVGLLEDLSRESSEVVFGILTGNFREATLLKLRAAGLDRFDFPVSAFAEDGATRDDLVAAALGRYRDHTGESIAPHQVIIVGDTPRDIATARATGCRVLAVATGAYSLADLAALHPDAVVQDLADPSPLRALLARARAAS